MRKKSIRLNAFLNSLRSILNILFPLITFPYVSRVLEVKGIGIYNFSSSIISYFLLVAGLGINTYAIREGAKYRSNIDKITRFSSEIFTINIASTVVSYFLLFLCLFFFAQLRNYISCICVLGLQIFFTTIGTEWLYSIYEDYVYITIRSIIFQILSIIMLFIFVKTPADYINYAFITVFSSVGANVFNFIKARKFCRFKIIFKFNWKKHLVPIFIIFAANIANMVYVNSDITLLGLIKNDYAVGIYSVSVRVYQAVKTFIASLLIVTVPRLSMLFGQKKLIEYENILKRLTNSLVLLCLPASTGLYMVSKEVVLIISGENYIKATTSLQILCFAYIFSILAWILTDCVLIPAKRERYVLVSMSTSALLNIVLNIVLIPFWSENAAAFSTVLAELCMLIVNYYYARDLINDVFFTKEFFSNFFTSIIGCLGIVLICWLCDIGWNSLILKLIFSILLSALIYSAILIFLQNKIAINMLGHIKIVVKNKFR